MHTDAQPDQIAALAAAIVAFAKQPENDDLLTTAHILDEFQYWVASVIDSDALRDAIEAG